MEDSLPPRLPAGPWGQLQADPFFADAAVKRQALLGMKKALTDRMARTQAAVAMAKSAEESEGDEDEDAEAPPSPPSPPAAAPIATALTGCARHA